ncbi:MAG: TorF family putative porin [Bacteroidota bacterium]
MFRLSILLFAVLVSAPSTFAQFGFGADFVSRYVFRGIDFGESFSVQPYLEYSVPFENGSFTVGTWASYSISADGSGANEHDLYVSASVGPISFGVTDYYFPTGGVDVDFFLIEDNHVIEPFIGFDGVEGFPVSLYVYPIVVGDFDLNDDGDQNFSTYIEASVPFSVEGVDLAVTLGVVPMESGFYLTDDFSVINVSLTAAKEIPITEQFALPVFVGYTLNPEIERTYLVFGVSL